MSLNRKQRRANEKKERKQVKDPAYMVKQSDIRCHINRVLRNDPLVQESIREEVRKLDLEEVKKQNVNIVTLILMSLHRREGFGRKRLLRFCSNFNSLQEYYEGRYGDHDLFAMRKHLKEEVGIDVERINEEVEKFLNENPNERKT